LLIGGLAASTGVNIQTIRYYEQIGILPIPPRSAGRHRTYGAYHVQRLDFIRRSRELGFSLDDIRRLLHLADRGDPACAETKAITVTHLADVRGKIVSLRKLERELKGMADACQPGNQCSCPIIDALSARADAQPIRRSPQRIAPREGR